MRQWNVESLSPNILTMGCVVQDMFLLEAHSWCKILLLFCVDIFIETVCYDVVIFPNNMDIDALTKTRF